MGLALVRTHVKLLEYKQYYFMSQVIFIVSENNDVSTDIVMDWISHFGGTAIRVNPDTRFVFKKLMIDSIGFNSLSFEVNHAEYCCDDITAFWYRRGYISMNLPDIPLETLGEPIGTSVRDHLSRELESLRQTIFSSFENKRSIGRSDHQLNKLTVLLLAKSVGIEIPRTWIVSDKRDIRQILLEGDSLITKSIVDNLSIVKNMGINSSLWVTYTEDLIGHDLQGNDSCFPSLVQEKLHKSFEIRIFFLNSVCYSMAIFSQLDNQTSTDFRKYNSVKPNRTVPFTLPVDVSDKLIKLMSSLNLNTGSIDMVYTTDGSYVFLEVNPVGQFGMVSEPCNYKLEKIIAKYLVCNE